MKAGARRRAYLREAAAMLILARLAVRFVPPVRLFAVMSKPLRRVRRFVADEADWVGWAIGHAGARPGLDADDLPRALAAHVMLRRRGIASKVCLGIAREGGALAAHAWVEVDGARIIGEEDSASFTRLAEFGAAG
jgi:hypothetical protein